MFSLSLNDFLFVAIFSLIFTWVILKLSNLIKVVVNNPTEFDYDTVDFTKIQRRCYNLFPKKNIEFNGKIFERGMFIKINTYSGKEFEGIFMGLNAENVICVLTQKYIVAYKLDGVSNVKRLKEEAFY